jgi:hypothetical protein
MAGEIQLLKFNPWGGAGLGTFGWAFPSTVATMFSLVGMGLAGAGSIGSTAKQDAP